MTAAPAPDEPPTGENAGDRGLPPGAGGPAAPNAPTSRAAAYRARQARQKAPWTATVAGVLAVVVVLLIVYLATSGALTPAPAGASGTTAGISVLFGSPTIGSTSCGGATTYPTEQLPIQALTRPFTTAQASIEIVELGDGDIISTVSARPETTLSALCTGAPPPAGTISWYGVLASAHGQNLATYTYSQSWAPVPGASFPATLTNDSSLIFVMSENIANEGYGTVINGVTAAVPINGEGTL
jgi:hypothetical protein